MYAVTVLGRLDGEDVEEHLAYAIKDESSHVRSAAIRSIEGKAGSGHLPALMLALTDEDSEVRALAAEVLGMTGDEKAVDPLKLALQDEDMWVRSAAVRALGSLCGKDAAPLIGPVLMDAVGMVSITAMETLDGLDVEDFLQYPIAALDHHDDEVVTTALRFLQYSGEKDWLELVRDRLVKHPHQEVRMSFARILVEIEGIDCSAKLEEMISREDDDLVRQELQMMLVGLKQGEA
jgi:HEAT repeat protein